MIFNFQLDIQSFSIISAFFAALILYFGKLIGDTQVEKYDKTSFYIQGTLFTANYIFFPSILAYFVLTNFSFILPTLWILVIQFLIMGILSWNSLAYTFRNYEIKNKFKEDANKKILEAKKSGGILGKAMEYGEKRFDIPEMTTTAYINMPIKVFGNKNVLLFLSFLTIFSTSYFFINGTIVTFGLSVFFTFFILTLISISYGFASAYYPPAEILLDDGSKIEGKVIKFDEFIHLINENEKIFVNSSKVKIIRESKFKEKDKTTEQLKEDSLK